MRPGTHFTIACALLLAAACREASPPATWQDHAVLTWAERLVDPDPWVRVSAAEALGDLGPDAAAAAGLLLNRFRNDESVDVRTRCAAALGQIGSPDAKAPLLSCLQGDDPAQVRSAAAQALVGLGAGPELLDLLLAALDARPETAELQVIANGFAAVGAPAVEPLARRLSPAAPDASRTAVALCLGTIGEAARPALPALRSLYESPDDTSRLAAILAFGGIGGEEACAALSQAMRDDPSASLQLEALIAGAQACDFAVAEPSGD